MNNILSASEAAKKLNVSSQTIKRWIKEGRLKGYQSEDNGGRWYVQTDDPTFGQHLVNNNGSDVEFLRDEITYLREQLTRRDEQIDHLTQLLAIAQKNVSMLTERMQVIEDLRHRKPLWERIFNRV